MKNLQKAEAKLSCLFGAHIGDDKNHTVRHCRVLVLHKTENYGDQTNSAGVFAQ
jgi:hypothetical protein